MMNETEWINEMKSRNQTKKSMNEWWMNSVIELARLVCLNEWLLEQPTCGMHQTKKERPWNQ